MRRWRASRATELPRDARLSRWFYPCSIEMQVNLAEMYVADPRFAATYDKVQPGLAVFLRDAIRVRAGRPAD